MKNTASFQHKVEFYEGVLQHLHDLFVNVEDKEQMMKLAWELIEGACQFRYQNSPEEQMFTSLMLNDKPVQVFPDEWFDEGCPETLDSITKAEFSRQMKARSDAYMVSIRASIANAKEKIKW